MRPCVIKTHFWSHLLCQVTIEKAARHCSGLFNHRGTEIQRFSGARLAASRKSRVARQPLLLRPPSGRNRESKSTARLFHAKARKLEGECPHEPSRFGATPKGARVFQPVSRTGMSVPVFLGYVILGRNAGNVMPKP